MPLKQKDRTIKEILVEERGYQEDWAIVMEVVQEIINQLLKEKFVVEDIYPAMFYTSVQMYLESEKDLEYGKQVLKELYDESIKSHLKQRIKLDDRTDPEYLDFFNSFVKEDGSKIH